MSETNPIHESRLRWQKTENEIVLIRTKMWLVWVYLTAVLIGCAAMASVSNIGTTFIATSAACLIIVHFELKRPTKITIQAAVLKLQFFHGLWSETLPGPVRLSTSSRNTPGRWKSTEQRLDAELRLGMTINLATIHNSQQSNHFEPLLAAWKELRRSPGGSGG